MSKLQREGMVVMTMESPEEKMSRIEQEEIFRQDREAKEKIIRDGIAVKVRPWERSSVSAIIILTRRFASPRSAPLRSSFAAAGEV